MHLVSSSGISTDEDDDEDDDDDDGGDDDVTVTVPPTEVQGLLPHYTAPWHMRFFCQFSRDALTGSPGFFSSLVINGQGDPAGGNP